jgi:hypothetical protein
MNSLGRSLGGSSSVYCALLVCRFEHKSREHALSNARPRPTIGERPRTVNTSQPHGQMGREYVKKVFPEASPAGGADGVDDANLQLSRVIAGLLCAVNQTHFGHWSSTSGMQRNIA